MGSPELTRGSTNRGIVDEDVNIDTEAIDGDGSGTDYSKKHLSSKMGAEVDRFDGSDSKRSVPDRYESRKRASSSNRASSDLDDDYDGRNESRFKQSKKNPSGNTLDELSASYQDAEAEQNFDDWEKPGNSGYARAEERVSKRPDPDNEEKVLDVERLDSLRDKGSGYAGRERRRRWDEANETNKSVKHGEEFDTRSAGVSSDPRLGTSLEKESRGNMEMQISPERSDRGGDTWKIRQEKENRESVTAYENMRDWELTRRGRDSRSGWRKDGNRTEAVKTSKYGRSNQNNNVIEIQPNLFDHDKVDGSITLQSEAKPSSDVEDLMYKEEKPQNAYGSVQPGEGSKDGVFDAYDHQADRSRVPKGVVPNRGSGGSLTPQGNQEIYNRSPFQSHVRGNRAGRVGRGQPLNQQSGVPVSMVASPFVPHGLPPSGPMQSLPPNMSPAPGQLISPGIFIPPFQSPIMWPGARGVDMNMLGVPLGLPPVPPGPMGPRFPPNLVNPSTGVPGFSPPVPGGGILPGMMDSNFNAVALVHPHCQDKVSGGWIPPPRTNAPPGKAPSRGEQNDYSQNFVDTGMRPQNYIRELELTNVVEDYPRLRELIQKKDEIVANSASPPMYYKCDLKEQELSPEFFGTKFDVILVDPPWEEYVHRAPGVTDHMEYWTFEEIMNLKIEAIADTPSFIFLCVGDGIGLEQGRQCLRKWGFRRCEDICWVKTNKTNATPGRRHDSHTLFQRSKEHYLMGIKGTVRRSTDGHIIHANIDTDVIIAEEPPYGSTAKPEDMYRIIEHFALGRRRLELFGEDHNIRAGWLTVGKGLSSSNFNREAYVKNFADKDGKVWVGGGGRNPPPEAPHLVRTTPDIEALRPKSPMKNQQQLAQSASISLTAGNSGNRRADGNMNSNINNIQEASSSSNIASSPAPWASERREGDGGRGMANMPSADMYVGGEFLDYQYHRGMNMF